MIPRIKAKIKIEKVETLHILIGITKVAIAESRQYKSTIQQHAMRFICEDILEKIESKVYSDSERYTIVLKDYQAMVWLEVLKTVNQHKLLTEHGKMVVQQVINKIEMYILSITQLLEPQKTTKLIEA